MSSFTPTTEYSSKFCEPITSSARIVVLQSSQGTGKSRRLKEAVDGARLHLALTHRRSLAQKAAADYGIPCHLDDDVSLGEHKESLSLVLDSLLYVSPQRFKGATVTLDEFTQVFRHLKGDTLNGKRRLVYQALKYILSNAERVIAADVNDAALEFLLHLTDTPKPKLAFVRNTYRPTNRHLHLYPGEQALFDALMTSLDKRERVVVACEAYEQVMRLRAAIREAFQLRLFAVTRDKSSKASTLEFYEEINARMADLDVLLFSPSMFSGIDINVEDCVDAVYLFATANLLPAEDLVQAVLRVRHPRSKAVHAFVDRRPVHLPLSSREVEAGILKERKAYRELLDVQDGRYVFSSDMRDLRRYVVNSTLLENGSRSKRCTAFETAMEVRGFTVSRVPALATSRYLEASASARKNLLKAWTEGLRAIETPAAWRVDRLRNRKRLTTQEALELERFAYFELNGYEEQGLEELFGQPLDTLRHQLATLEELLGLVEPHHEARHTFLNMVEASYGGFQANELLDDTALAQFIRLCSTHQTDFEAHLGLKVNRTVSSRPRQMLGKYLEQVLGMKLHSEQDTKGSRRYVGRIDEQRRAWMLAVVERRNQNLPPKATSELSAA